MNFTNQMKAFLVMMVLGQHLCFAYFSSFYDTAFSQATLLLRGDVAVGVLFLLSGWVLAANLGDKDRVSHIWIWDRLGRLMLPMMAIFAGTYFIHLIGGGPWGQYLTSMGYDWGYLNPIGFLGELMPMDLAASFLLQLVGFNDQIVLVAWILKHELILSIEVFIAFRVKQRFGNTPAFLLVIIMAAITAVYSFGYGVHLAFFTGVVFRLAQDNFGRQLPNRVLIGASVIVYALIFVNSIQPDEWRVALINDGAAWLVKLMTDYKYWLFSGVAPLVALFAHFCVKNRYFSTLLSWVGDRAYSLYLTSQAAMQLSALFAYKLAIFLPVPLMIAVVIALTVLLSDLFYRFIEKPTKHLFSSLRIRYGALVRSKVQMSRNLEQS